MDNLTRVQILETEKKTLETDKAFLKQKMVQLLQENKFLHKQVSELERRNFIGSNEYNKLSTSYNEMKATLDEMNRMKSNSIFDRIKDFQFMESFAHSLNLVEKGFGDKRVLASSIHRDNEVFQTFAALADAESMLKKLSQTTSQKAELEKILQKKISEFEDSKVENERLNRYIINLKRGFQQELSNMDIQHEQKILKLDSAHEQERYLMQNNYDIIKKQQIALEQKLEVETQSKNALNEKKEFFEESLKKLQTQFLQLDAKYKESLKYEQVIQQQTMTIDNLKGVIAELQLNMEVAMKERKNDAKDWQIKLETLKREKDKEIHNLVLGLNKGGAVQGGSNALANQNLSMSFGNKDGQVGGGDNGAGIDLAAQAHIQHFIQKIQTLENDVKMAESATQPLQNQLQEAMKTIASQKEEIIQLNQKVKEAQLNSGAIDPKILQEMEDLKQKLTFAENSKLTMRDAFLGKIADLKTEIADFKKLKDREDQVKRMKDTNEGKKIKSLSEEEFISEYFMMQVKMTDARQELAKIVKLNETTVKTLKDNHLKELEKFGELKALEEIKDSDEKVRKLKEQLLEKNKQISALQKEVAQLQELKVLTDHEMSTQFKALEGKFEQLKFLVPEFKLTNPDSASAREKYQQAFDFAAVRNSTLELRYQNLQTDYQITLANSQMGGDSQAAKEEIEKLKKEVEMAREDASMFQNKMAMQMMTIGELQEKEDGLQQLLKKNNIKIPPSLQ